MFTAYVSAYVFFLCGLCVPVVSGVLWCLCVHNINIFDFCYVQGQICAAYFDVLKPSQVMRWITHAHTNPSTTRIYEPTSNHTKLPKSCERAYSKLNERLKRRTLGNCSQWFGHKSANIYTARTFITVQLIYANNILNAFTITCEYLCATLFGEKAVLNTHTTTRVCPSFARFYLQFI